MRSLFLAICFSLSLTPTFAQIQTPVIVDASGVVLKAPEVGVGCMLVMNHDAIEHAEDETEVRATNDATGATAMTIYTPSELPKSLSLAPLGILSL